MCTHRVEFPTHITDHGRMNMLVTWIVDHPLAVQEEEARARREQVGKEGGGGRWEERGGRRMEVGGERGRRVEGTVESGVESPSPSFSCRMNRVRRRRGRRSWRSRRGSWRLTRRQPQTSSSPSLVR